MNNVNSGAAAPRVSAARLSGKRVALLGSAALALMATAMPAFAVDTTIDGWQVNIDTTLSSSVDFRTSPQNPIFIGAANGGKLSLANADNGDLNFKQGSIVGAQQRITTELQIKKDDYGLFVRATGFIDPVIDQDKYPFKLSSAALHDIGADAHLLDAYIFARPRIFDHPFDVRIGNQALNWGESTFIQFGINSINPLDTTALRTPGAELRQGFLPIPVVDVKTDIGAGFNLEGFWQFAWTRTRLEPDGSFFSTNDTLTDGGTYGNLSNYFPDNAKTPYGIFGAAGDAFGAAYPRSLSHNANTLNEFGFALRKTFSSLDDTEFGLYFENYASRTPFGSQRTGVLAASLPNPIYLLTPYAPPGPQYALSTYDSTASYFADFPQNIHLIGFSWNFTGPDGIAFQGEISSRLNQPLQLAAADLALATDIPALKYAIAAFGGPHSPVAAPFVAALSEAEADPAIQATGSSFGFDSLVQGWKRYPVIQIQQTATKLFPAIPSAGINQITLVGEVGMDYVANFPKYADIFDAPYTTDLNSAFEPLATVNGNGTTPISTKGFATQTSAAYTIVAIVDMPSVLPYGIDMKPTFSVQHDFYGTSPVGANVFVANTAAASMGVTFNYLQAWSANIQYTNHFPFGSNGKYDGLLDRDFVSATVTYEF